ncbi:MAG: ATP-binding protein [Ilumatobacteraceae bacterium]
MKWRLLGAFAGLTTVVLLAQDVPLADFIRETERSTLVSALQRDAFILAGAAEDLLSGEDDHVTIELVQSTIDQYALSNGSKVVVTDPLGRIVASSDDGDRIGDDYSNRPEISDALDGRAVSGDRNSETAGPIVYVAVPVLSGGTAEGVVRITIPADIANERANAKVRGLGLVAAISLVGAAIAAFFMAGNITSPIRRLQRSTERLASGDFSERAATDEGAKEIRGLATSFNTMAERVAGLLEQQRAFAGDASHQLRTPLTALRLQLERAGEMIDTDPEHARERIDAAREETERLQRLVEGLLMLARSEGTTPQLVTVDVTTIARERYDVWAPLADEREVHLTVDVANGLTATAMPTALEQIIDNYVDNALGAARRGDTITIGARRTPDGIEVSVADEGPGMEPEHLSRAFDRFWRAPNAPHGGSGIGLAVVRQLAMLSGGTVRLGNRPGSGLVACVVLQPAAGPAH